MEKHENITTSLRKSNRKYDELDFSFKMTQNWQKHAKHELWFVIIVLLIQWIITKYTKSHRVKKFRTIAHFLQAYLAYNQEILYPIDTVWLLKPKTRTINSVFLLHTRNTLEIVITTLKKKRCHGFNKGNHKCIAAHHDNYYYWNSVCGLYCFFPFHSIFILFIASFQ